ncbi:hypothetical protein ACFX13_014116 [Malus domestica]
MAIAASASQNSYFDPITSDNVPILVITISLRCIRGASELGHGACRSQEATQAAVAHRRTRPTDVARLSRRDFLQRSNQTHRLLSLQPRLIITSQRCRII